MILVPLYIVLGLAFLVYPSALPLILAYFMIGGAWASFMAWGFKITDKPVQQYRTPALVICLYAWPVSFLIMLSGKGKNHG